MFSRSEPPQTGTTRAVSPQDVLQRFARLFTSPIVFIFSCRSVGCGRKNFPIHQRSYSNTPAAHRRGHANLQAQNVSTDVSEHAPDL